MASGIVPAYRPVPRTVGLVSADDLDPILEEPSLEHARLLADRIMTLGHERRYPELYALANDARTEDLLSRLGETPRFRARLQLTESLRWAESKRRTAARRLEDASKALDALDLDLARGLLARVDGRFLDEDLVGLRDELLLSLSARTMEAEELSEVAGRIDEDADPPRRRRWWRRG
jgi:hypothetical protein